MKVFKTGILGGSFDPPTLAHALMAAELLNKHIVDKVVFVPCGSRDDKLLTGGEHRLKMLQLMIDHVFPPTNRIEINDIEIQNGRMIPTYHMLKRISKEYENIEFVIGSDLVETLIYWDEGEKLRNEMSFIILNRDTNSLPTIRDHHFPEKYTLIPQFSYGISSTEVRTRIKQAKGEYLDCLGMVVKEVLQYIIDHKLYL